MKDKKGEKVTEGKLVKGVRDGMWTSWWKNGNLAAKVTWKKGKRRGPFELFNMKGEVTKKGTQGKGVRKMSPMPAFVDAGVLPVAPKEAAYFRLQHSDLMLVSAAGDVVDWNLEPLLNGEPSEPKRFNLGVKVDTNAEVLVGDDRIIVATKEGNVTAWTRTGEQIWTYTHDGPIAHRPRFSNSSVSFTFLEESDAGLSDAQKSFKVMQLLTADGSIQSATPQETAEGHKDWAMIPKPVFVTAKDRMDERERFVLRWANPQRYEFDRSETALLVPDNRICQDKVYRVASDGKNGTQETSSLIVVCSGLKEVILAAAIAREDLYRTLWTSDLPVETCKVATGTGVVWVRHEGSLKAIDSETGREIWEAATKELKRLAPIANGRGVIVVAGSEKGSLIGIVERTGDIAWKHNADIEIVDYVSVGSRIIYLSENTLGAIDAATGTALWRKTFDARLPRLSDTHIIASERGRLVVLLRNEIASVDASTGDPIWRKPIKQHYDAIIAFKGKAYVVTRKTVVSFSVKSGRKKLVGRTKGVDGVADLTVDVIDMSLYFRPLEYGGSDEQYEPARFRYRFSLESSHTLVDEEAPREGLCTNSTRHYAHIKAEHQAKSKFAGREWFTIDF